MSPDRRQVRRAIPRPLRHFLYDHSPSRSRRWRENPGLERVADGAVSITFDDGPDADGTPAVLDALDALDTRATFFVVGEQLRESPDLARRMRDDGHEMALHGMTHRRHDGLSIEEARAELGAGIEEFEGVLGQRPRWYRPPYGGSSPDLVTVCEELDLELAYWSSWGFDWEPLSGAEIARLVLRDLAGGTIVLLHDSTRYAEREDARPTSEALAAIAGAARERGLELGPLSSTVPGADG
jgi:peptidoglycan-N-acetylglucosamine deacetylase